MSKRTFEVFIVRLDELESRSGRGVGRGWTFEDTGQNDGAEEKDLGPGQNSTAPPCDLLVDLTDLGRETGSA